MKKDTMALLKAYRAATTEEEKHAIRNEIIEQNMNLVYFVLRKMNLSNVANAEDLYQEGILGMMHSLDVFDINMADEVSFSTYAYWHIFQRIQRYISQDKTVRLPVHLMEKLRKFDRLYMQQGYTIEESMQEANINEFEYESYRRFYNTLTSLDTPITDDEDVTLLDKIDANGENGHLDLEDPIILDETHDELHKALSELKDKEQFILNCRFGRGMTLEETGKELGITRERVRQIEQRSLVKLKNKLDKTLDTSCLKHYRS